MNSNSDVRRSQKSNCGLGVVIRNDIGTVIRAGVKQQAGVLQMECEYNEGERNSLWVLNDSSIVVESDCL